MADYTNADTAADESQVVPRRAGPPPGVHRRGRRTRVLAAALALSPVVVAFLTATLSVVLTTSPSYPAAWDPRVSAIAHFVEQTRGLTFEHPVEVSFLGDAAFDHKVSVPEPTSQSDKAALKRAVAELRALGLLHGNVDLTASLNSLTKADVVGLYVDREKTIYVRGSTMTPFVRVTLAHELTHALQDQHFDLGTLRRRAGPDDTAVTALVEGDATRIQTAYEKTLSPADGRLYEQEQSQAQSSAASAKDVPPVLADMLQFPYIFGATFVDALAEAGSSKVDQAFVRPPVTEAQIADPITYPVGWRPAAVPAPTIPAGDHAQDKPQPFGQVSLFEVLGSRIPYDAAWQAVQGWRGDQAVPYVDHGRTCVAVAVRFGGAAQAGSFGGAAKAWADALPTATVVVAGDTATVRSCDPGPSAAAPAPTSPSAFEVLAIRAQIIDGLINSGALGFRPAACVADHVMSGLGSAGLKLLASPTTSLTTAEQSALRRLVLSGARQCRIGPG